MPDESAADDGESLRERVSELEQTVSEQQDVIQRLMPSRRQTVAGLGLLGAGVGAGRLSSGTARAEAAGQVGTDTDPVDVKAWDLDVQNGAGFNGSDVTGVGALETEDIEIGNKLTEHNYEQSPNDISEQRDTNTTYQNTEGTAIWWGVRLEGTSDDTFISTNMTASSTSAGADSFSQSLYGHKVTVDTGEEAPFVPILVPEGYYYRLRAGGDTADWQIDEWYERRWQQP